MPLKNQFHPLREIRSSLFNFPTQLYSIGRIGSS